MEPFKLAKERSFGSSPDGPKIKPSKNGSQIESQKITVQQGNSEYEDAVRSIGGVLPKRIQFEKAVIGEVEWEILRKKYPPLKPSNLSKKINEKNNEDKNLKSSNTKKPAQDPNDDFVKPKYELFTEESVNKLMKWKEVRKIGAGLQNLGNTCFLNSALQCLTYTAPLVNYIMQKEHSKICRINGFCMFCALEKQIERSVTSSGAVLAPKVIVSNLKGIAKHFKFGRQEDSHEFLRYVVDGIQKSCLHGLDLKLEPRIAETTVVHRIFGGYLRSQVRCSVCSYKSNTYDPFLDLSLEIQGNSIETSLQRFTKPEILDKENKYMCPKCQKRVQAQKQFTIRKAPNVLTIQLKRFNFFSMFGNKIDRMITYPERLDLTPYLSKESQTSKVIYNLYAVLVHMGESTRSGHYYSFVKNSSNVWYCMDDSSVRQVSAATALKQKAYMLFYLRDSPQVSKQTKKEDGKSEIESTEPIGSQNADKKRKANDSESISDNATKKFKQDQQTMSSIDKLRSLFLPKDRLTIEKQEPKDEKPTVKTEELTISTTTTTRITKQTISPSQPVIKNPKKPQASKAVVESLTSAAWTQYGVSVKNWDGKEVQQPKHATKKERKSFDQQWNEEYDQGRIKKVKEKKEWKPTAKNPFQLYQSRIRKKRHQDRSR